MGMRVGRGWLGLGGGGQCRLAGVAGRLSRRPRRFAWPLLVLSTTGGGGGGGAFPVERLPAATHTGGRSRRGAETTAPPCSALHQWWRNAIFAGMVSPCHF